MQITLRASISRVVLCRTMSSVNTSQVSISPIFETELTRLYEARDIEGLHDLLAYPDEGVYSTKIADLCYTNDIHSLAITLAHPKMNKHALMCPHDQATADHEGGTPLASIRTSIEIGNIEALRLVLESPFVDDDILGGSPYSLYPLILELECTPKQLECIKLVLSHPAFDPSLLEIDSPETMLSAAISTDSILLVKEVFSRYDDTVLKKLLSHDKVFGALKYNNTTARFIIDVLLEYKLLDMILTPKKWILYPIASQDSTCVLFIDMCWSEAKEHNFRFCWLAYQLYGKGVWIPNKKSLREFATNNAHNLLHLCLTYKYSHGLKALLGLCPNLDLTQLSYTEGTLFSLCCSIISKRTKRCPSFVIVEEEIEKLRLIVSRGVNPNLHPSPEQLSLSSFGWECDHLIKDAVRELCEEYSGSTTKHAST